MLGFPLKKIDENNIAHPVLKWAGGKGMLLPQLSAKFPNKLKCGAIKRYIEPFVGGGAVFFEIYNNYYFEEAFLLDINPELIILYNVIKNNVEDLISELQQLQTHYKTTANQKLFYYQCRDKYNTFNKFVNANNYTKDFILRAALTIFLNRTCFNGLFRVNANGLFNVPMGRYKNPKILDIVNLQAVSNALQTAIILQADFACVLNYVNNQTFIYYDPPYRPLNSSSFTTYTVSTFDDLEQRRLKEIFDIANQKGALEMLSNSDPASITNDPFFDILYKDYNIDRVWAKRMINSDPSGRQGVSELLITNYT